MITQHVITLNGNSQNLLTALSLSTDSDPLCYAIIMQPKGTNAGVIYVGCGTVSDTACIWRLEAGASGVPPAPFILGEMSVPRIRLSELSVKGANNEVLFLGLIR